VEQGIAKLSERILELFHRMRDGVQNILVVVVRRS
jgi:hypothetical protein